jgi:hypothetical protein
VPGPWYGETTATKYAALPADGDGSSNCCFCPAGAGVPLAAIRAHELAGRVVPGKAVNDELCLFAPVSSKVPLKVMSPRMAFVFVALLFAANLVPPVVGLALADERREGVEDGLADCTNGVLALAGRVAPTGEAADELQAATAAASSIPIAAGRTRPIVGRRIGIMPGTGGGSCMKGV